MSKAGQGERQVGSDYSEDGKEKECPDCNKITATLIINNLLKDDIGDNVTICLSQSLKTWLFKHRMNFKDTSSIKQFHFPLPYLVVDSHCTVKLKNIKPPFTWDGLDEKIKQFNLKYQKGSMPPTQFKAFKADVKQIVNLLNEHTNFNQFLAILAFLKHHPDVNEVLLRYAVTGAELQRDDISHIIINPFEVRSTHLFLEI